MKGSKKSGKRVLKKKPAPRSDTAVKTTALMPPAVWAEVMSKIKLQEICRIMPAVSKEMRGMITDGPVFPRLRKLAWDQKKDAMREALDIVLKHHQEEPNKAASTVFWDMYDKFEEHLEHMERDPYWKDMGVKTMSIPSARSAVPRQQLMFETFIFLLTRIKDITLCDQEEGFHIAWTPLYIDSGGELELSIYWFSGETFHMSIIDKPAAVHRTFNVSFERFPYEMIHVVKGLLYAGYWPLVKCNPNAPCTCKNKHK